MITQELLKSLLTYNPDTGKFFWLPRPRSMFSRDRDHKTWNTRFAGTRAGCVAVTKRGYTNRQIAISGHKIHREHRLAWIYMTGEQPPEEIDHRNRDATDNRWANIRDAAGQNSLNLSMKTSNKSGVTGVCFDSTRQKWMASCTLNRRTHYLGRFDCIDSAKEAVVKFRAAHGYTLGHGERLARYHDKNERAVAFVGGG